MFISKRHSTNSEFVLKIVEYDFKHTIRVCTRCITLFCNKTIIVNRNLLMFLEQLSYSYRTCLCIFINIIM